MNSSLTRFLQVLAAVAGLLVLFHLMEDWRGQRAWARVLEARRAAGLPADLAGFAPPAVPDAENFGAAPLVDGAVNGRGWGVQFKAVGAAWDTRTRGNWRLGQVADRMGGQKESRSSEDPALAPYGALLAALDEASRRPHCCLPLAYRPEGIGDLNLMLGARAVVRTLTSRALWRLEQGRDGEAWEDVMTGLRVARHLGQEPWLDLQLLRSTWLNTIFQPLWEGIRGHRWSDAQLAALQAQLGALEVLGPWRRSLQFERVRMEAFYPSSWSADFKAGQHWSGYNEPPMGRSRALLRSLFLPVGWRLQNQVRSEAFFDRILVAPLAPEGHRVFAARAQDGLAALKALKATPYSFLANQTIPALSGQTPRWARLQVGIDQAWIACALERRRLARKTYPGALQDLGLALPSDVMTGVPYRYQAMAEGGYRLWSLGWSGVDTGGAPGPDPKDDTQGDWCWTVEK